MRMTTGRIVAALGAAALAMTLAACGGSSSDAGSASGSASASTAQDDGDKILRIAFGSNGADGQAIWDSVAEQFKAANPGWDVQFSVQNDDLYETVGLTQLLTSGEAPDVYFEWAGARLANKVRDGYAAPLNDLLTSSGVGAEFPAGAFAPTTIDGKVYMMPFTSDITNVIWYNKDIFAAQGITPPKTWEEMVAAADKLKAAGITPFAIGNKDLWVAGNWMAHVISRVAGEAAYDDAMSQRGPLNSPAMVKGMDKVAELAKAGYINESANTLADNEAYTMFFQGDAAMLPIGSWIVGIQAEEAPDFSMGWFNLPAIADGAGKQDSIMAVTTGYILNAKSTKQAKAMDFMKLFFDPKSTQQWIDAGFTPVAKTSDASAAMSPLAQEMVNLLNAGGVVVAPPDTGYDLKVADALNTAISQVIDGAATPQEALDQAEAKLKAK